jgi:hypothetical protein
MDNFKNELGRLIYRCGMEQGPDGPNFILADILAKYLNQCRIAFNHALEERNTQSKLQDKYPVYVPRSRVRRLRDRSADKNCSQADIAIRVILYASLTANTLLSVWVVLSLN